jgi:hypothetical protein
MRRTGLWAACVVLILLVGAGVLTVGAGYANDEPTVAKCSEATLHGRYLLAFDGVHIKGNDQVPFAVADYEVYNGNGKVDAVFSSNFNGQITHKEHASATNTVKADCTGTNTFTDGSQYDLFIAPDGSMFTFVQTKAKSDVTSGTAKRVGD